MKAIALRRKPGEPVVMPPAVDVIVDSAIVHPGRPLFLPDFAPGWVGKLYPAYRVSRLGKGIAAKFASRYYDAVTIALRLVPRGLPDTGGLDGLFDNALALGEWQPVADTLIVEGGEVPVSIDSSLLQIDEAVAAVSAYATLKQGDIIMPCALPGEIAVNLGDTITRTLNGIPCLSVRLR